MSAVDQTRDEVVCISPLERPDPGLVVAACASSCLGVLALGTDRKLAEHALRVVAGAARDFGVRVAVELDIELPEQARTVVVANAALVEKFPGRRVLAEVTSLDEARAAIAAGAS